MIGGSLSGGFILPSTQPPPKPDKQKNNVHVREVSMVLPENVRHTLLVINHKYVLRDALADMLDERRADMAEVCKDVCLLSMRGCGSFRNLIARQNIPPILDHYHWDKDEVSSFMNQLVDPDSPTVINLVTSEEDAEEMSLADQIEAVFTSRIVPILWDKAAYEAYKKSPDHQLFMIQARIDAKNELMTNPELIADVKADLRRKYDEETRKSGLPAKLRALADSLDQGDGPVVKRYRTDP